MRNYLFTLFTFIIASVCFAQTSPSPNAFKYQAVVRNNENQAKIDGETLFLGDEKKAWSEFLSYIKTQFPVGGFYYFFIIGCDQMMKSNIKNAEGSLKKSLSLETTVNK